MNKIFYFLNLFKRAFWEYRWHMMVLTLLSFLSGIFGGIGINALIPAFSLVVGEAAAGTDLISQYIQRFFGFFGVELSIVSVLALIVILFILKAATLIVFSYISARITSGYEEKTRRNLFGVFINANWPYLIRQKLGHLERVLMENVGHAAALLSQIGLAIMAFTNLIVYSFVALNISVPITIITIIFGALLFFLFLRPLSTRMRVLSVDNELINRDVSHFINESMLGLKVIRASGRSEDISLGANKYFGRFRTLSIKGSILSIFSSMLMEPIGVIFISGVFTFSYFVLPDFGIAALAAVVYLIRQIFAYLEQLYTHILGFAAKAPYVEILLSHQEEAFKEKEENLGTAKFNFERELQFQGVNFSYGAQTPVLKGVNLVFKKGSFSGIIGPSGAGKTTVVDLILRLLKTTAGKILLDGKDVSEISMQEWRKNIGYVSQDIFLMNDTISNNIKFFGSYISDEKMKKSAQMANIGDFIESLPEKFNTTIGERGLMLSGGQRQRIAIARVLVGEPQILVLDEATSALDNESELKIQKVIENLKGKVTVIVIAHRLSTLMNSDTIFSLKDGKIMESGSYKELLRNEDSYLFKTYNIRE